MPGCVPLVDILRDKDGLGLVMPYYPAGDLNRFIRAVRAKGNGKLPEQAARILFVQIVRTFQGLHEAGIIHRDLKPENILVEILGQIDQSDPKVVDRSPEKIKLYLSDFGFAITLKELKNSQRYQTVGTPTYLPVEMLVPTGKDERIEYDERVDIWCLGILLYNFLFGKTPFMTEPFDKEKTKKLIK